MYFRHDNALRSTRSWAEKFFYSDLLGVWNDNEILPIGMYSGFTDVELYTRQMGEKQYG